MDKATRIKTGGGGGGGGGGNGVLGSIPDVDIAEGKWKYVQIELSAPGEKSKRVRLRVLLPLCSSFDQCLTLISMVFVVGN